MTNREEQRKGRETAVNAQAALREKAVTVTGLSKSYSGKKVIDNLNLTIGRARYMDCWEPTARERARPWNVYWGPEGLIREKCGYWEWTGDRAQTSV